MQNEGMNQGQLDNYGKVRRVQWLVNTVTAAEGVSVPCFVAGTVLGLCWYMVRRLELGSVWMWSTVGVVAVLLIGWGLWHMRGRWFSRRDTEALLDEQLGLNAALCAREQWGAAAVTAQTLPDGQVIKLRSAPWAAWMVGGVVLAICGGLLPLPEKAVAKVIPDLPPSLVQVEKALDMMEESGQIEEKSLEPFRDQLQDLKKKSYNEMFSHAGLETADALKGKAAAAVAGLSNEMFKADAALSMFENVNGASDMEGTQALKDALKGMQNQEIQPGGMVGRQLQELAQNADLSNLTPEQIQQLRQQLAQAAQQLRDMAAQCGMGQIMMPKDGDQPGQGDGEEGEEGEGPGQGGISRGKGDAPLAFRPEAYEKLEALPNRVENNDLRRAALGDVTGVEASAPSPEHETSGPEHGGSGAHPSKGGDAVWSEELTPREQEALKGIFK